MPRRRGPISIEGQELVDALRSAKEQGVSGRLLAERFRLSSESSIRDYISGRRQPSAAQARRALEYYREEGFRPGQMLTTKGLVIGEPLDRRSRRSFGTWYQAFGEAEQKGRPELVGRALKDKRLSPRIKTTAGVVELETDPERLRQSRRFYSTRNQIFPFKSEPRRQRRAS